MKNIHLSAADIRKCAERSLRLFGGNRYKVADDDLSFGFSLMQYLGKGNLSASPVLIRTALAMLYEGAAGETAEQIADKGHIPKNRELRRPRFRNITGILNATGVPYTVKFANGLWADYDEALLTDDFQDVLREAYRAECQSVNFKENFEGERVEINRWVDRKTEQKIRELFPEGSFNHLTALVLANALYFKAPWMRKFNRRHTRGQDFKLSDGKTVQVDMMRKGEIDSRGELPKFQYNESDIAQTLVLPYKGGQLAKIILLPKLGFSTQDIEFCARSGLETKLGLDGGTHEAKFSRIEIPRHEIKGSYDMMESLKQIGISKIFEQGAELDKISKTAAILGSLYVSSARHQTYFKTDEEGSEGAAAVGIGAASLGASPLVEFVADRPFLEMVVEYSTGSILFLNRVEDPRKN